MPVPEVGGALADGSPGGLLATRLTTFLTTVLGVFGADSAAADSSARRLAEGAVPLEEMSRLDDSAAG